LLYLVKAGVPVKEAIYFVSQPLVREYVDEQRLAKSTFAEVLGKAPEQKSFVKYQAATNIVDKYFNPKVLPAKGKSITRFEVGREMFNNYMKDRKDKNFTAKEMLGLIRESKNTRSAKSSDLSLTMFLHYLDIEDQIKGITQIKMNANPDTNTKSVLSDIETSEGRLENLESNDELQPIISALMGDSIISSFFNNKLALSLAAPLFKLRYNSAIRTFIKGKDDSNELMENIKTTFGEDGRDNYLNTFRNDLVTYIFQNAIVKTDLKKGYMSYDAREIPAKEMLSDKFGAFVKTNKDGSKTLFYNLKNLEEKYNSKEWSNKTEEPNYYSQLGLHPLPANTFTIAKGNDAKAYARFVMEREYLRSVYPIAETEMEKAEYEEFLANRALDNTFNVNHMFRDPKNAFAIRVYDVITSNPKLANRFDILSKLQLNNNINDTMFNLELIDRDIDNIKANIYTKNLTDLADPVVLKTLAKDLSLSDQDITYISDLFSRLPLFAYMQSGINKTSANLVPYVSTTPFLNIMDGAVEDFTKLLADPGKAFRLLEDFYNKFNAQNSYYNKEKNRFKNYFTDIDFNKVGTGEATQKATQPATSVQPTIDTSREWKGDLESRPVYTAEGVNTMRTSDANAFENFGNPFSEAGYGGTIKVPSIGAAVIAYKEWLLGTNYQDIKPEQRAWILDQINQGKLDGATLLYAGKSEARGQGMHPTALAEVVEQIRTTQPATSVEEQIDNLIATPDPNIFIFDDAKTKTAAYYRELTSSNSTVGFVYNASKHELDKNLTIGSQSFLKFVSPDTALPFITSFGTNARDRSDNFSNLAPENYQSIKNYFDRKIQELKDAKDLGSKIALPIEGIGNANKMPQELFVYLSKRLFEELGYLNPGSTMYKDITEILNNKQGISDDEILASLGFESDPFNCV